MVNGIIKNTHIILSKVTKFIWLFSYNNLSKMDMYFETEGVILKHIHQCNALDFYFIFSL